MSNKGSINIIILVLIVIAVGAAGYFVFMRKSNLQNQTANWQIYRNEEYGFEVRYPVDFVLKVNTSRSFTSVAGITGQAFLFSPTTTDRVQLAQSSLITVVAYKNITNLSVEEFFNTVLSNNRDSLGGAKDLSSAQSVHGNDFSGFRINPINKQFNSAIVGGHETIISIAQIVLGKENRDKQDSVFAGMFSTLEIFPSGSAKSGSQPKTNSPNIDSSAKPTFKELNLSTDVELTRQWRGVQLEAITARIPSEWSIAGSSVGVLEYFVKSLSKPSPKFRIQLFRDVIPTFNPNGDKKISEWGLQWATSILKQESSILTQKASLIKSPFEGLLISNVAYGSQEYDLPFVALVPRGHDVYLVTIRGASPVEDLEHIFFQVLSTIK